MHYYKCTSCKIKKVDPELQFYSGIPLIFIDNEHIKNPEKMEQGV